MRIFNYSFLSTFIIIRKAVTFGTFSLHFCGCTSRFFYTKEEIFIFKGNEFAPLIFLTLDLKEITRVEICYQMHNCRNQDELM